MARYVQVSSFETFWPLVVVDELLLLRPATQFGVLRRTGRALFTFAALVAAACVVARALGRTRPAAGHEAPALAWQLAAHLAPSTGALQPARSGAS